MSSYFEPDPLTPTQAANVDAAATVLRKGTTKTPALWPGLANAHITNVSPDAVYGYSAWKEIVAAGNVGAAMIIGVVLSDQVRVAVEYEIQIGQGAAGVEAMVWKTHVMVDAISSVGIIPSREILVVPGAALTTNARLSSRIAANVVGVNIALMVRTLPTPA